MLASTSRSQACPSIPGGPVATGRFPRKHEGPRVNHRRRTTAPSTSRSASRRPAAARHDPPSARPARSTRPLDKTGARAASRTPPFPSSNIRTKIEPWPCTDAIDATPEHRPTTGPIRGLACGPSRGPRLDGIGGPSRVRRLDRSRGPRLGRSRRSSRGPRLDQSRGPKLDGIGGPHHALTLGPKRAPPHASGSLPPHPGMRTPPRSATPSLPPDAATPSSR